MTRKLLLFLLAGLGVPLHAQQLERVMIPIRASKLPGLFGSVWQTELIGINQSDVFVPVKLFPDEVCAIPEGCPGQPGQPHQFFVLPSGEFEQFPQGFFVYVGRDHVKDIHFQLLVLDTTRRELSLGADIPVPREDSFTDQPVWLLNVPVDTRFRTTLRVYGLDNVPSGARVRLTRLDLPGLPKFELQVSLAQQVSRLQVTVPSYGAIADLAAALPPSFLLPGSADAPRIAIEVTSVTPGQRLWPFATVTNNSTQHVTVFASQ